jgi:catechol 2,3-dioxygenase-like lactoylglutathione lyase family enzyme
VSITRLNHAVLYVRDLARSVEFYRDVLGFRQVDMTPEGFDRAAFLQAASSSNDHDLGLFQLGAHAGPSGAGRSTVSLYGKDPDGLEFEIAWIIPAAFLDATALAGRASIGTLDLAAEKARYGADTVGGIGISTR